MGLETDAEGPHRLFRGGGLQNCDLGIRGLFPNSHRSGQGAQEVKATSSMMLWCKPLLHLPSDSGESNEPVFCWSLAFV